MKHNILICGLICEFFACLRVPVIISFMHPGYRKRVEAFGDYEWLWVLKYGNPDDFTIIDIDTTRFIITMTAIAILTAICYLIANNKNAKEFTNNQK